MRLKLAAFGSDPMAFLEPPLSAVAEQSAKEERHLHWTSLPARRAVASRKLASLAQGPNASPTTDSRFGRETPKTTSRNALQPLSMRVRRISALKKWVNSRLPFGQGFSPHPEGERPKNDFSPCLQC